MYTALKVKSQGPSEKEKLAMLRKQKMEELIEKTNKLKELLERIRCVSNLCRVS